MTSLTKDAGAREPTKTIYDLAAASAVMHKLAGWLAVSVICLSRRLRE